MADYKEYIAYMDETGHAGDDNQHFCGMAGFLATSDSWTVLDRKWKQTLNRFRVDYMHMKEYAHSKGVFTGWKGDESKRKAFYSELLSHLREIRAIPFGSIVSLDGYRKLSDEDKVLFTEPYLRSLADCVGIPAARLEEMSPEIKYSVVFSEQAEFRHKASKVHELFRAMYRIGERMKYPSFDNMMDLVPLQAADMIAYELHREFGRQVFSPEQKPRYGYPQFKRMAERTWPWLPFYFHTENEINRFVSYMRRELDKMGLGTDFSETWRQFYADNREIPKLDLPLPIRR